MQNVCIGQPWHYFCGKAPDMKVKEYPWAFSGTYAISGGREAQDRDGGGHQEKLHPYFFCSFFPGWSTDYEPKCAPLLRFVPVLIRPAITTNGGRVIKNRGGTFSSSRGIKACARVMRPSLTYSLTRACSWELLPGFLSDCWKLINESNRKFWCFSTSYWIIASSLAWKRTWKYHFPS